MPKKNGFLELRRKKKVLVTTIKKNGNRYLVGKEKRIYVSCSEEKRFFIFESKKNFARRKKTVLNLMNCGKKTFFYFERKKT